MKIVLDSTDHDKVLLHRVRIAIVIFAVVGIGGTFVYSTFTSKPVQRGVPAQARIVDDVKDSTTDGKGQKVDIYTAILEYNANGKTVKQRVGVLTSEEPHTIGEEVSIEYDPVDPTKVYVVPERGFKALYLLLLLAVPFILRYLFPLVAVRIFRKIKESFGP